MWLHVWRRGAANPFVQGVETLAFRACTSDRRVVQNRHDAAAGGSSVLPPTFRSPGGHGAPAYDRNTLEAAVDNEFESPRIARAPRSIVLGLHDLQLGRAIRVGIEEQGLLEVVGAASTAEGLVELAGLVHPDVILVDEVLATTEAARVDALRTACDAAVIVLVEGGATRRLPLPAGATAYLDLRPADELVGALADVATIAVELGVVSGFGARSA